MNDHLNDIKQQVVNFADEIVNQPVTLRPEEFLIRLQYRIDRYRDELRVQNVINTTFEVAGETKMKNTEEVLEWKK